MKQTLAQLRNFLLHLNKKSTLLISFFLLLLIFILYVAQARLGKSFVPPTAFLFSNVTPTSAAVSFVTGNPENVCFVLLSSGWPQLKISCDFPGKRVHYFTFSNLREGARFKGLIVSLNQLRTWTSSSESVGNRLADITFAQTRLPELFTPSNVDAIHQTASRTIAGTVVDTNNFVQTEALVVLIKGKDRISSVTNGSGAFSLVAPDSWVGEDVFLLIWSESGYVELPQPLDIIADQPQTIEIQPYEF